MEPLDKNGIVCFVGESPYGERVFYLKHHGYFKLPSGLHFTGGHLVNAVKRRQVFYQNAGEFIEVFERELYQLWQVDELKTTRAGQPTIYMQYSRIDRLVARVDLINTAASFRRQSSVTRTIKLNESMESFARRVRGCYCEVLAWWRERFITTPRKLLEFTPDNPLDEDYPNPIHQFRTKERFSNRYLKLVGYTKYQRPILDVARYGYFIAPAGMGLSIVDNSKIKVVVRTTKQSRSMTLDLTTKQTLIAGLKKALDLVAKEGPLKYHTAMNDSGNIHMTGAHHVYYPPMPIRLRDQRSCITSLNKRELVIRRAADRQWIKDNLETTDINRALTLHKEIPEDPM